MCCGWAELGVVVGLGGELYMVGRWAVISRVVGYG